MLDLYSRSAIIGLSALCVVGVIALAPSRARSSVAKAFITQPTITIVASDDTTAILPLRRDPFAEPIRDQRATLAPAPNTSLLDSPGSAQQSVVPQSVAPRDVAPLPSNLSTDSIPMLPGAQLGPSAGGAQVTAIVTGSHPYAMIAIGAVHEIKGLGDLVGGVPIVAIDFAGVRLQNGTRLTVEAAGQP